jgi:hypothetical protein
MPRGYFSDRPRLGVGMTVECKSRSRCPVQPQMGVSVGYAEDNLAAFEDAVKRCRRKATKLWNRRAPMKYSLRLFRV